MEMIRVNELMIEMAFAEIDERMDKDFKEGRKEFYVPYIKKMLLEILFNEKSICSPSIYIGIKAGNDIENGLVAQILVNKNFAKNLRLSEKTVFEKLIPVTDIASRIIFDIFEENKVMVDEPLD